MKKKLLILTILLAFFMGSFPAPAAAIPVINIPDLTKWALDAIAPIVANIVVNEITNQTVKWIEGGGKPKFITDPVGILTDAADQAAGQVLQDITGANLCEPFKLELQIALLPVPAFGERVKCSLSDVVANVNDFYSDFRNGGWAAWAKTVEPRNNFYGAYLLALDEQAVRAYNKIEGKKQETQVSGGFLSEKRCLVGNTEVDGKTFADREGEKVVVLPPGYTDNNGNTVVSQAEYGQVLQDFAKAGVQVPAATSGTVTCKTVTPGSLVKDLVEAKFVKEPGEKATRIDSFTQMLAAAAEAVTNAALNRALKEGITTLRDIATPEPNTQRPVRYLLQNINSTVEDAQRTVDENKDLVAKTVGILDQTVRILQDLKTCNPLDTGVDGRASLAQNNKDTITKIGSDLAALETLIAELKVIRDKLPGANSSTLVALEDQSSQKTVDIQNKTKDINNKLTGTASAERQIIDNAPSRRDEAAKDLLRCVSGKAGDVASWVEQWRVVPGTTIPLAPETVAKTNSAGTEIGPTTSELANQLTLAADLLNKQDANLMDQFVSAPPTGSLVSKLNSLANEIRSITFPMSRNAHLDLISRLKSVRDGIVPQ